VTHVGHVPVAEAEVALLVHQDLLDLRHDVLKSAPRRLGGPRAVFRPCFT
jgi:hypothetical protein